MERGGARDGRPPATQTVRSAVLAVLTAPGVAPVVASPSAGRELANL
jgi:hypothetical protein